VSHYNWLIVEGLGSAEWGAERSRELKTKLERILSTFMLLQNAEIVSIKNRVAVLLISTVQHCMVTLSQPDAK